MGAEEDDINQMQNDDADCRLLPARLQKTRTSMLS